MLMITFSYDVIWGQPYNFPELYLYVFQFALVTVPWVCDEEFQNLPSFAVYPKPKLQSHWNEMLHF